MRNKPSNGSEPLDLTTRHPAVLGDHRVTSVMDVEMSEHSNGSSGKHIRNTSIKIINIIYII